MKFCCRDGKQALHFLAVAVAAATARNSSCHLCSRSGAIDCNGCVDSCHATTSSCRTEAWPSRLLGRSVCDGRRPVYRIGPLTSCWYIFAFLSSGVLRGGSLRRCELFCAHGGRGTGRFPFGFVERSNTNLFDVIFPSFARVQEGKQGATFCNLNRQAWEQRANRA